MATAKRSPVAFTCEGSDPPLVVTVAPGDVTRCAECRTPCVQTPRRPGRPHALICPVCETWRGLNDDPEAPPCEN